MARPKCCAPQNASRPHTNNGALARPHLLGHFNVSHTRQRITIGRPRSALFFTPLECPPRPGVHSPDLRERLTDLCNSVQKVDPS